MLFPYRITACLATLVAATVASSPPMSFDVVKRQAPEGHTPLQTNVTWDSQSLLINGERIMILSGEFHPFRLPSPSLWLDVFQKVKALGFNTVSFYVDWALLEGKPGDFRANGVFALDPFFDAATQAGIYLIARPGPYINAEVSGGGFPGWLQRLNVTLRSYNMSYLEATDNYISHVAGSIAKAQITNGGPVILYQPENEYSGGCCGVLFPDPNYMQYVEDQARKAGVTVPFINNDAWEGGHNAPGTGLGQIDIYGFDNYPLGFDCSDPKTWPGLSGMATDFYSTHLRISPNTPLSLDEFQGGSFDPWGGTGYAGCAALLGPEFERVVYKNNVASGAKIVNLYMIYGGMNWGNLGYPGGYSSYDYGAAISESRNVTREKYSELKLLGNFLKASPSYLTASPQSASSGIYTDTTDLTITPVVGNTTAYFVVRHNNYTNQSSIRYKLKLPTSAGNLTVPQLGGVLSLNGRDSKIHVVNYDLGGTDLLYSTAEIFTWKKYANGKILVLYGGPGEHHELAISSTSQASILEGLARTENIGQHTVVSWDVASTRQIVVIGDMKILLLDRNSAYNYWVPECPTEGISPGLSTPEKTASSIIVKADYLVRSAHLQGADLHLTADFNTTSAIEVIAPPKGAHALFVNSQKVPFEVDKHGFWTAKMPYVPPKIELVDFKALDWKYLDTLPELSPTYDDSTWRDADIPHTTNTFQPLNTSTSLFGSDYGFNTGYLVFRGHFVARGTETDFFIETQGGTAFGSSVWLNNTHLGSFAGNSIDEDSNQTYSLPPLTPREHYTITVVIDQTGMMENWVIGLDDMKDPRGIISYQLFGSNDTAVTWKVTGNFGGEDYMDKVRGPLNEGGLYCERQGFHQPQPPSDSWETSSPFEGISKPGIAFYSTSFELDVPDGWDVPLSFQFGNNTSPPPKYRAILFVNGYQFGKYINNIGPQTQFHVPQGILNYQGTNWVGVTLWAQQPNGAKLDGFQLVKETPVLSALAGIRSVEQPRYYARAGAY
ncbi:uncharacterized protein BHQ10_009481 [Talaromyces amestolkiae]|uniref:Beta-galactosidase n=1 Tax=Talaromyces amestolkiae TaxID=1196081 RepID=A0A364LCG6_TALAM|nr:uncharacterized protein BHQ10_009481 [Talaromyces amestolkiae]RAO73469.1 hypothetical protein BHQ10_009481 [Talaromyces amestolkiae]